MPQAVYYLKGKYIDSHHTSFKFSISSVLYRRKYELTYIEIKFYDDKPAVWGKYDANTPTVIQRANGNNVERSRKEPTLPLAHPSPYIIAKFLYLNNSIRW
jgi:hypothetical protein